jgi:hypothetical protein
MNRLWRWPLWCIEVFTWAKSFRNNPVIGSPLLNRLGLHVFRVALAHGLFRLRLLLLSPLVSREDRRRFLADGFLVKRDFLPAEEFEALRRELAAYHGPIREISEGDTLTQRIFLNRETLAGLPCCQAFTRHGELRRLMRYASSKNRPPFFYIENLKLRSGPAARPDPQQDLHSDTFHPCVKAWLYIDDVSARNAPFVYVPGSHRLSWRRLAWEYRESLKASRARHGPPGEHYWDGSFRLDPRGAAELGYPPPLALEVPANTLVIGNVRGFHRRGDATEPSTRMTIWMQARDNPFNPLFTPFPEFTARVFEAVWTVLMDKRDARMARSGRLTVAESGFERY